ncbi:MAG: hypothetical protein IKR05_13910 [Prevotella sp.]|nr:hypothetical protein [Prevotella sp.]
MRKIYMMFAVLGAFLYASTASAGVKNLYKQDFESSTDPAAIGWSSPNLAGGMSITGDQEGNYFQFSLGNNNGRNCSLLWGSDIYGENNSNVLGNTYHVEFGWCYKQGSNNQYGTQVCVFSGEKSEVNNGNYVHNGDALRETQWLFALTELDADRNFYINDDKANTFIVNIGEWMLISLDVNVETRTVAYTISDIFGQTVYASGERVVPEATNIYATGINQYNARYQSIVQMDDIKVTTYSEEDIANPPTVALTGINGIERTYKITFGEEEELHIKGTDGAELFAFYYECDGAYTYTTSTSGTLEAWTESGTAVSEKVVMEVECVEIALPGATAKIISVEDGFGKKYSLNVSNADVPTQPTLFLQYSFVNENGVEEARGEDRFSGEVVEVKSKGTLTVTTVAPGFASTTVSIVNDREFQTSDVIDFQHMTGEELANKGFQAMDPLDSSSTSGETNWTGRLRMYYQIATGEVDEEGKPTYTTYPVYGSSEAGYEPIQRYRYLQSNLNEETAHSLFAPLYLWYGPNGVSPRAYFEEDGVTPQTDPQGAPGGTTNAQVKIGIGLVFSGQVNDDETFNPNSLSYSPILINYVTLGVDGLTESDFIVVEKIDNYGGGSIHPQYPAGTDPDEAKAMYKASNLGGIVEVYTGLETFQFYRVDTAVSRVRVFKAVAGDGIEELSNGEIISDHNAPIYNLNGVQVNSKNLQRGIYIKQGKKFIVR